MARRKAKPKVDNKKLIIDAFGALRDQMQGDWHLATNFDDVCMGIHSVPT